MTASRRSFLGSLALLPFASAVLPTAPAAPAPVLRPRVPHNPAYGPDFCDCDECCRERVTREDHGLTCRAILALDAADAALARLLYEHCEDGVSGCDLCGDAAGLQYVIGFGISGLYGQVIEPAAFKPLGERRRAARAAALAPDVPAGLACVLALHDVLDALLDLTDGHCLRENCYVCTDADGLIHHVQAGIDLIGGGLTLGLPTFERQLLTFRRMVARSRDGKGGWMPNAAYAQTNAEGRVKHLEHFLREIAPAYS